MMHFVQAEADQAFLAELKDAGVLDPGLIERIDAAMGRPESGALDDFLLAGAPIVPEKPWLSFLIRRHGCHRFGRVAWRDPTESPASGPWPADGNLAYGRAATGELLVAVLRPDRLPLTEQRLKPARLLPAAATLGELRALRGAG